MRGNTKHYSLFLECGRVVKIINLIFLVLFFLFSYKVEASQYVASIKYDLSAVPQKWQEGDFITRYPVSQYRLISCNSTSDTENGACPVEGVYGPRISRSSPLSTWGQIKLAMHEKNTHQNIVVNIAALRWSLGCVDRYPWDIAECQLSQYDPAIKVGLDGETLKNIPVGIWEGNLVLNQRDYKFPSNIVEKIYWKLTVEVTDSSKQMIYFPAFPTSDPHVDLNLTYRPGSRSNDSVSGTASLDMCLYDGGTSAKMVQLQFLDDSRSLIGKDPELFSVYRDGADKNKIDNTINYKLQVLNPTTGVLDQVSNGKAFVWKGANARNIQRNVVLPGIPGVSLCLPAPLKFITPVFDYSGKNAGHYTGVLKVIYSISTH
ncbi:MULTISPECIES: CfaE/CblD family pilus tip adhesin [Rosenbergiella]|uniref:CfaE/CblD family pilus tip adhesin n=1 Tax=Rosenbergiella TaxID=1356488 RepID=UPI001F4DAEDC|nr:MULTISPECIES: CfaE/CblD family pilus tip adhesin [Rosenbergiella]